MPVDLIMKTTIHWRTIFLKVIGVVLIVFAIIKMTVNPAFFTFLLVVGVIFLWAGKILRIEIDNHEIRFIRYYLNGTIKKTDRIKLADIVKVEYEEGSTIWEDLFLSAIPSRNPDKLIIYRKHEEPSEYELYFYKSEIRVIVEILNKSENRS
ncbi:hypothetical protein O3Q51_14330 [Cryomorphaceae bacterium 1068]|nr:hypothetical protein [Cryomorphaceae bacterium 1068]